MTVIELFFSIAFLSCALVAMLAAVLPIRPDDDWPEL